MPHLVTDAQPPPSAVFVNDLYTFIIGDNFVLNVVDVVALVPLNSTFSSLYLRNESYPVQVENAMVPVIVAAFRAYWARFR